jgi:hypothetical protein
MTLSQEEMTMNELNYALKINGKLFRTQRELLLKITDLAGKKQPYVPVPGDAEVLDGLMNLCDAIADQAHDRHGIDCLLEEDDV